MYIARVRSFYKPQRMLACGAPLSTQLSWLRAAARSTGTHASSDAAQARMHPQHRHACIL